MAPAGKKNAGKRQDRNAGAQYGLKSWLLFVVLLAGVMASATAVVYSTHRNRQLLNALQELEQERNGLQVEWGQLLLEQSSLVSQGRIENLAIAELGMKIPEMENVVVVTSE